MNEQRIVELDVTELRTEGRKLAGYAATFDDWTTIGTTEERIAPGAFDDVLSRDGLDVVLNLNHDDNQVLARTTSGTLRLSQDQRGLAFEADLPASPLGENVREAVKRGDIAGASFRFVPGDDIWDGDKRTIASVADLLDICAATRPAYPTTSVEVRTNPGSDGSPKENTMQENTTTEPEARVVAEPEPEPRAGALTIESRDAAEERTIEERVREELRSVAIGEVRALTTSATISTTELSTFLFDRLRSESVALRSGIRTIQTSSDSVTFPTIDSDQTVGWTSEAGTITPTPDIGFSSITATPRKLAALSRMSNELIDDSDPSAVDVMRDHLLKVLALKLDLGIFEGSGTPPEITGLKNVSGIGGASLGTADGAVPTDLDFIADAIGTLETANSRAGAIAMHPRTWKTLLKLKELTSTSNKPLLQESAGSASQGVQRSIYGVPVYLSSQLSVTETKGSNTASSSVYVFDPAGVYLVRRQDTVVELDRSRLFNTDESELRAKLRADLIVPDPTVVYRVQGVRAS